MRESDNRTLIAFEAVATVPNILQAKRLLGEPDYILRVVADVLFAA